MLIIYHCLSGGFLAPVAAAIHLGLLTEEPPPAWAVTDLPFFQQVGRWDGGFVFHCGRDTAGHEICLMGYHGNHRLILQSLQGALAGLGGQTERLLLINSAHRRDIIREWAVYLCQCLSWHKTAKRLAITGVLKHYPELVGLVCTIRGGIVP